VKNLVQSRLVLCLAALLLLSIMAPPASADPSLTRVSLTPGDGEFSSYVGVGTVSSDHQTVVFMAERSSWDFNRDVYVRDLSTGVTTLINVDPYGNPSIGDSTSPQISANGDFVVFASTSTDLVDDDDNGDWDIFRRDLATDETELVSTNENDVQGDGLSVAPTVSANGRYVAFISGAENLVLDDTNGTQDIFVKDMTSGEVTRVNVTSSGDQAESCVGCADWPMISGNGNVVAFQEGVDLTPNDDDPGGWDIYRHNLSNGNTIDVTEVETSSCYDTSMYPSISYDGSVVAYFSDECDLVPNDTNDQRDAFVWEGGDIDRVSVPDGGGQTNGYSDYGVSVSPDGSLVGFLSWADDLVPGDTNGVGDAFIFDRTAQSPSVTRITSNGTEGDGEAQYAPVFASNSWAVVESAASNLVNDDTNGRSDLFLVQL
jgi:Tol biopolymer transport system component